MMRVIVCGSRTWTNRVALVSRLEQLCLRQLAAAPETLPIVLVHGACPSGADKLADDWARLNLECMKRGIDEPGGYFKVERHPADWKQHGKAAGAIRNSEMAALGADICIAFRMPGKSNGTDDMVKKARAAGIPVEVVTG